MSYNCCFISTTNRSLSNLTKFRQGKKTFSGKLLVSSINFIWISGLAFAPLASSWISIAALAPHRSGFVSLPVASERYWFSISSPNLNWREEWGKKTWIVSGEGIFLETFPCINGQRKCKWHRTSKNVFFIISYNQLAWPIVRESRTWSHTNAGANGNLMHVSTCRSEICQYECPLHPLPSVPAETGCFGRHSFVMSCPTDP